MSITVESLDIEVRSNALSARNNIDKLADSLSKLRGACQNGAGLKEVASALERMNRVSGGAKASISSASDSIKNMTSSVSEAKAEMNDVIGVTQAMSETTGKVDNALGDVGDSAKKAKEEVEEFKGEIKENTKQIKNANVHFSKLTRSIGRIAVYRALRTMLKEIANAFKEGRENLYYFSQAIGSEFSRKMDGFATQMQTFKNQLGSAFGELTLSVLPLLQRLIDFGTRVADTLSQIFASLRGKLTYNKAKDLATSWKEATNGVKAYQSATLGIDELNILNDNAGGSGASTPDYSSMFEESAINLGEWQDEVDWIREHLGDIKQLAIDIGIAFATWKISKAITDFFKGFKGMGKEMGLALSVIGFSLEFAGAYDWALNGANVRNVLETVLGGAFGVVGGLVAFGTSSLIVTIPLAIALPIIGYEIGLKKLSEQNYNSSEFKAQLNALRESITNNLASSDGIDININARLQNFEEIKTKFKEVTSLISEMYSYNENGDFTNVKMLADKITELTGVSIDLDPDGKLVTSKEKLDGIVQDMLLLALEDTAREQLADAWWDNQVAISNAKDAMINYSDAQKLALDALEELKIANQEYENEMAFDVLTDNLGSQLALFLGIGDANKEMKLRVDEAKLAVDDANKALEEARQASEKAQEALEKSNDEYSLYNDILQNTKTYTEDILNPLNQDADAFEHLKEEIAEATSKLEEYVNLAKSVAGVELNVGSGKTTTITAHAEGGFPANGQLFIANEAGSPEMVGSWGNGTAVANSDQIINGIQSGVANAVSMVLAPYLSQIANNTRETANKNFSVNIGDRDIARANNRGQKALGRTIVSTS